MPKLYSDEPTRISTTTSSSATSSTSIAMVSGATVSDSVSFGKMSQLSTTIAAPHSGQCSRHSGITNDYKDDDCSVLQSTMNKDEESEKRMSSNHMLESSSSLTCPLPWNAFGGNLTLNSEGYYISSLNDADTAFLDRGINEIISVSPSYRQMSSIFANEAMKSSKICLEQQLEAKRLASFRMAKRDLRNTIKHKIEFLQHNPSIAGYMTSAYAHGLTLTQLYNTNNQSIESASSHFDEMASGLAEHASISITVDQDPNPRGNVIHIVASTLEDPHDVQVAQVMSSNINQTESALTNRNENLFSSQQAITNCCIEKMLNEINVQKLICISNKSDNDIVKLYDVQEINELREQATKVVTDLTQTSLFQSFGYEQSLSVGNLEIHKDSKYARSIVRAYESVNKNEVKQCPYQHPKLALSEFELSEHINKLRTFVHDAPSILYNRKVAQEPQNTHANRSSAEAIVQYACTQTHNYEGGTDQLQNQIEYSFAKLSLCQMVDKDVLLTQRH